MPVFQLTAPAGNLPAGTLVALKAGVTPPPDPPAFGLASFGTAPFGGTP